MKKQDAEYQMQKKQWNYVKIKKLLLNLYA